MCNSINDHVCLLVIKSAKLNLTVDLAKGQFTLLCMLNHTLHRCAAGLLTSKSQNCKQFYDYDKSENCTAHIFTSNMTLLSSSAWPDWTGRSTLLRCLLQMSHNNATEPRYNKRLNHKTQKNQFWST